MISYTSLDALTFTIIQVELEIRFVFSASVTRPLDKLSCQKQMKPFFQPPFRQHFPVHPQHNFPFSNIGKLDERCHARA